MTSHSFFRDLCCMLYVTLYNKYIIKKKTADYDGSYGGFL